MPRPPPLKAAFTISGKPIFCRNSLRVIFLRDRLFRTRNHRQPGLLRKTTRRCLVSQQVKQVCARTYERDSSRLAGPRQRGIFGEETVPRMNCIDAVFLGQRNNTLNVQIGFGRVPLPLSDQISLISLKSMEAEAIPIRINGNRANSSSIAALRIRNSDFTAIQGK